VHDIYPDVAVRLGILQNRQLIKFVDRMEAYFYKHAGFITVLSEGFKENLFRKGVPVDKTVVIPACTDVEFIQPLHGINKLRAQWKLDNKFVVLYTANIGLPQGLDNVVRAAQLLLQHLDIAIVFVGEGAAKSELQNMVKEMRLQNVHFFPLQPREDVPLVFGLADVSLVSLRREIAMESVPSKTYSIMASGRAVLATVSEDTEIANLIRQTECGLVVPPEDPNALASAILELYHNAPLREVMAQKGRDYVVEHFCRAVAFNKYQSIILHLVNGHYPQPATL
jgi:colanic acid biosynthesis glycosyl transferase WcaI